MSSVLVVIVCVVVIEIVTFFGRWVLKNTGPKIRPCFEWRGRRVGIHHGLTGAILLLVYGASKLPASALFWGFAIGGITLIVDDLFHHLLLKLIYGEWDPVDPHGKRP